MFAPLAFTKTYSMAGAAILSITLVPVLMGYFIRGKVTPEEFTEASIQNPAIRRFLPMIKVAGEPEYEALFPDKQPNLVTIETASGESFEEYVEFPRGHYKAPLEKVDLLQKFAALAAPELNDSQVEEIYDLIMRFDELDTMTPFFGAIRIR